MLHHPGYILAGVLLVLIIFALFTGHDPPNGK